MRWKKRANLGTIDLLVQSPTSFLHKNKRSWERLVWLLLVCLQSLLKTLRWVITRSINKAQGGHGSTQPMNCVAKDSEARAKKALQ
jgi:hypothetical protein